jgi:hypothetical protein
MLINLYLISVAISILALFFTDISISQRIKREGFKEKRDSPLSDELRACLVLFIPFINLYLAWVMLFRFENIYESMKSKCMPVYLYCGNQFVKDGVICCKEYSGENYSNKCSYDDYKQGVKCLQYKGRRENRNDGEV